MLIQRDRPEPSVSITRDEHRKSNFWSIKSPNDTEGYYRGKLKSAGLKKRPIWLKFWSSISPAPNDIYLSKPCLMTSLFSSHPGKYKAKFIENDTTWLLPSLLSNCKTKWWFKLPFRDFETSRDLMIRLKSYSVWYMPALWLVSHMTVSVYVCWLSLWM